MATSSKHAVVAPNVTWAQAARDVLIAAINRGQLPSLLLGAIMFVMVWKLPESDVGPIINRVLTKLEDWSLVGWVLLVLLALGWYLHSRAMRERFALALKEVQKGG